MYIYIHTHILVLSNWLSLCLHKICVCTCIYKYIKWNTVIQVFICVVFNIIVYNLKCKYKEIHNYNFEYGIIISYKYYSFDISMH